MSRARHRSCSVLKTTQYALIVLDPQRYCGLGHTAVIEHVKIPPRKQNPSQPELF